MIAAKRGHLGAILLLISYGCDLSMQDNEGSTALHYACDSLDTVILLVERGLDPSLRNAEGLTAEEISKEEPVKLYLQQQVKLKSENQHQTN